MATGQNVTNAAASGRFQVSPLPGTLSLKNHIVIKCVTTMFKIYLQLFNYIHAAMFGMSIDLFSLGSLVGVFSISDVVIFSRE